jgi:dTDP-4-dehydrorhamnose 3,5-epimerase
MRVIETGLPGLLLLEPKVFRDERGFFLESYSRAGFAQAGIAADFVQDNHACSTAAGVLRGLHFQLPPVCQAKLVWVTRGAVLDVVVDLRVGSPTYLRHYSVELSAENFQRLFVPKGFAHAYLTLTPHSEFQYKVDAPYSPANDAGLRWNDPDLGIAWPTLPGVAAPLLSPKDQSQPLLKDFVSPFVYESPAAGPAARP